MEVGLKIKQINDKLKILADESLKESHLTIAQAHVLEFINQQGGKVTQKEIEDYLEVSHPTVVGIVSRLENNGYVTSYKDEKNKRNKIVCKTVLATEMEQDIIKGRQVAEDKLVKNLTEDEINELNRMLDIMYKNMKGE